MYNQLTSEQRYEIYLGIKRKWSISRISREIEVSASTVLREIRRNSNTNGEYVWRTAQRKAEARKHGLEGNHRKPAELWWRIEQMIEEDWSPSQIASVLHKEVFISQYRPSTTTCMQTPADVLRNICRMS